MSLTVAHLFAGGGGGILASEILGHRSILAIEKNEHRCNILRERKSEGWFPELAIHCADIRNFDFEPWAGRVDCLAAGFLARIFQAPDRVRESREKNPGSFGRSFEQLTLFGPDSFSSKTVHASGPEDEEKLLRLFWRADIPGVTERLRPLTSELGIYGIAGGSLLPTVTVCGNYNRKGLSKHSGDGLATKLRTLPTLLKGDAKRGASPGARHKNGSPRITHALRTLPTLCASDPKRGSTGKGCIARGGRMSELPRALKQLPTLCATDYKAPYSKADYRKQKQTRSKPLRDTLAHSTGHRLTSAFAEWWMGWPLGWTACRRRVTGRSRSRRRSPG